MAKFEFDAAFRLPEFASSEVIADTREEAETLAYEWVRQTYPEADDIEVTGLEEVDA